MALLIDPELNSVSIVLIGNFNPSIFQPYWFSAQGLIAEQAASSAKISVIHPEVTNFAIDSFFALQVTTDRFSIERTVAPWILIADMVVRMFGSLLPHTPVGRMGINRIVHFKFKDAATRERIGRLLAPRDPWGEFGKRSSGGTGPKHGGLQSMSLIQRDVSDRPGGWILTKIEPSARIAAETSGVYMEVNDHYDSKDWPSPKDAQEIVKMLEAKFDQSLQCSENIINQIMGLGQ
jgi:hypothetical protein